MSSRKRRKNGHKHGRQYCEKMSYEEEARLRYDTMQRCEDFDYADMETARYIWVEQMLEEQENTPVNHDFKHSLQPWLPFTGQEMRRIRKHRGKSEKSVHKYIREELMEMFQRSIHCFEVIYCFISSKR